MKKITTAIILSMSGLIATTAMAAPHDHYHHQGYETKPLKSFIKMTMRISGVQAKSYHINTNIHVMSLTTAHTRN